MTFKKYTILDIRLYFFVFGFLLAFISSMPYCYAESKEPSASNPVKIDWREAWLSSTNRTCSILLQLYAFNRDRLARDIDVAVLSNEVVLTDLYRACFLSWSLRLSFDDRRKRRLPHQWISPKLLTSRQPLQGFDDDDPLGVAQGDYRYITEDNFKALFGTINAYQEQAREFKDWIETHAETEKHR